MSCKIGDEEGALSCVDSIYFVLNKAWECTEGFQELLVKGKVGGSLEVE